jgi:hypothetical protein
MYSTYIKYTIYVHCTVRCLPEVSSITQVEIKDIAFGLRVICCLSSRDQTFNLMYPTYGNDSGATLL